MKQHKIKILHILGGLNMGGAETLVMNFYRKLDRNKFEFDFLVHGDNIGTYEKEINSLGGKVYRIPKYKVYNHLVYKKCLSEFFIKHPEYKIIHCHVRSTASIILKIAKKYNRITICHSHNTSNGNGIRALIKNILQRNIVKYADDLFAGDNESGKWLFKDYFDISYNNCEIISNAIDSQKFKYNSKLRNKVRSELGLDDKFVIGQVGRFDEVKNHNLTLNVLKKLVNKNKKYYLILVGHGPLENKIKEDITKMNLENNVLILKNRNDVNELMQAFDLFVMPSLYEGLPLVLIEAQAASLKCFISKNIESGILIEDLVKKESIEFEDKWVEDILKYKLIKRNDTTEIIKASGFDISNNVQKLEDVYSKMNNKFKQSRG